VLHYLTTAAHDYTMRRFLATRGRALRGRVRPLSYETLWRARRLQPGTYVFADLERLSSRETERAARIHAAVTAAGWRALNHPTGTRRRYELLRLLAREGVNDFGVYRASEHRDPQRWPVFLRSDNEHQGAASELLHTPAQLAQALAAREAAGRSRESTLIVEFRDTADAAGVYRKYAAFCVAGEVLPRHVCFGRRWMLKAGELFAPEQLAHERAYVETNPHRAQLERIFALARVGYGRADYAVVDGAVRVWEINTNPNMDYGRNFGGALREVVHAYFNPRMEAALRALADPVPGRAVPNPVRGPSLRRRLRRWRKRRTAA
jgi:hypothetical protein